MDLYTKPWYKQGEVKVRGYEAEWFDPNAQPSAVNSFTSRYWFEHLLCYGIGAYTYWYCTRFSRAQRGWSTLILAAVPLLTLFERRGQDSLYGNLNKSTLQERLEFYPITKRAFERALEIYLAEQK